MSSRRCCAVVAASLLLWLGATPQQACAASYVFPGNLPVGCSGSGSAFNCGALTLTSVDTVALASAASVTIKINGDLTIGGARINQGGASNGLDLVVTGALVLSTGTLLVANVTAGTLTDSEPGATVTGSIAVTGDITFSGDSALSGNLDTSNGTVTVSDRTLPTGNGAANTVGGRISSGSAAITVGTHNAIGGAITSQGGVITVGFYSQVGGNVSTIAAAVTIGYDSQLGSGVATTSGVVTIGYGSQVTGTISSTTGPINVGYNSSLGGATSTTGLIALAYGARVTGVLTSTTGAIGVGYSSQIGGDITSSTGAITLGYSSAASACVQSTGSAAISLGSGTTANAVCCGDRTTCSSACVANSSTLPMPALCSVATGLDHFEIRHASGSGLTCSPSTLTVVACKDASCATPYTDGANGTLAANGSGMTVVWPGSANFVIPAGASSTSVDFQDTSVGNVALGMVQAAPSSSAAVRCNFGSPACTFSTADSGFVLSLPNHVAEQLQTIGVSAVRKSDSSAQCVPAFASVAKPVTFACGYRNPASGTASVRVGGVALNAAGNASQTCDGGGHSVSLAFNAQGVASTTLQYADVGQIQLNARYTGSGNDAGLGMIGTGLFIAAPATFAISGISAGPIKAGNPFGATVTARNSNGDVTPNFGAESTPESATLTFARAQPTGAGASDGTFSGSLGAFSRGAATVTNLVWSEVGRADLNASLTGANYLGSGLGATGTTGSAGAVGRFIADHFDVAVTPACASFSYAGQPFGVTVTAMNGLAPAAQTLNYDGSAATAPHFAQSVTLGDAPSLGSGGFGSSGLIAATAFNAGSATTSLPAYTYNAKLTPPATLVVRALDTDGVSSAGHAEGSTVLRSGRLRMSNAFGSEKAALQLPVQAQYWGGNSWLQNSEDYCSVVPAAAVALAATIDNKGAPTSALFTTASAIALLGGNGALTLSAPSPSLTGSVDLALNLGLTAADQSCLSSHPPSSGAALPWLRSQQGSCASAWDRDPAARASFGIYAPETRKTMYVRDIF